VDLFYTTEQAQSAARDLEAAEAPQSVITVIGGVRVDRRMREKPVQATVQLREDHLRVDRHPVDWAFSQADLAQGDRVVEVTETGEEAVVSKTARVGEEVVVGKKTSHRAEHVKDTVRKTEVEIEKIKLNEPRGKRQNSSISRRVELFNSNECTKEKRNGQDSSWIIQQHH